MTLRTSHVYSYAFDSSWVTCSSDGIDSFIKNFCFFFPAALAVSHTSRSARQWNEHVFYKGLVETLHFCRCVLVFLHKWGTEKGPIQWNITMTKSYWKQRGHQGQWVELSLQTRKKERGRWQKDTRMNSVRKWFTDSGWKLFLELPLPHSWGSQLGEKLLANPHF